MFVVVVVVVAVDIISLKNSKRRLIHLSSLVDPIYSPAQIKLAIKYIFSVVVQSKSRVLTEKQ